MTETINHIAITNDWESENDNVEGPLTLILGTCSPYNPTLDIQSDFYYGRIAKRGPGNYLWKTIGTLHHNNKNYFQGNLENKLQEMNESKFIFMDIINSITFTYNNQDDFTEYKADKIFKNFSDQVLFTNKTNGIQLQRTYNSNILEVLRNKDSIKHVINTLGRTNGGFDFGPKDNVRTAFITDIRNICEERNIDFDIESLSPSPQAVGGNVEEFQNWVQTKILR